MYFAVYGFDMNYDYSGTHTNPYLCTVKADDIEQAEKFARMLKGFCDGHYLKGYIEETTLIDLTEESEKCATKNMK